MQHSATERNVDVSRQCFGCVGLLQHLFHYLGICFIFLIKLMCIPFKDFFASVQRASKRDNNNRTPGEGTCFELGKEPVCLTIQLGASLSFHKLQLITHFSRQNC